MLDDRLPITTRWMVLILFAAWVVVISCSIPNWSSDEPVLTPNVPTATSNQPTSIPNEPAPTLNVPTATPFQPILITSEPALTATITTSTGSFELVGHTPLLQRGMNAALLTPTQNRAPGANRRSHHAGRLQILPRQCLYRKQFSRDGRKRGPLPEGQCDSRSRSQPQFPSHPG